MPKRKRNPLSTRYTKFVVIDHIVEDEKSNNTLENLNPITQKENTQKSAKLNPDRRKGINIQIFILVGMLWMSII